MLKKFVIIMFFSLCVSTIEAQCPMCKAALKSSQKEKGGRPVGLGLNKGILFLMTVPYFLVGSVGVAYYYKVKKSKLNK